MPIVAGIGGNSGNRTITMIVRAVALGQVSRGESRVITAVTDSGGFFIFLELATLFLV